MPFDLNSLLNPKSIAILGASERPSIGRALMGTLKTMGYEGGIYPINPKYDTILGQRCYGALSELPEPPDVVSVCLSGGRAAEGFKQIAECGARAAVIYDAGFAESGEEGRARQRELSEMCREANIALQGPNCMGSISPWARAATYLSELIDPSRLAGNVGFVSQSGSVCIGMLSDLRRYGYNHMISSGNEAVLSTADYIDFLLEQDTTRVIATFIETVNEPEKFVAALDKASSTGIPVIALKVGRSARAQRAVTSHTGGLAGKAGVFSEVLRAHRAIEVRDLDEMSELLAVCSADKWPSGRDISVITASGGQSELILDLAEEAGLSLPPLPRAARDRIESVVGELTGDGNPADAWGNGNFKTNLAHTLEVMRDEVAPDAITLCMDSTDGDPMGRRVYEFCTELLTESALKSDQPHYFMNTRAGVMNETFGETMRRHGVVSIGGTRQGLAALDRLGRYATWKRQPRSLEFSPPSDIAEALRDAAGRPSINERDAKTLLSACGFATPRESAVTSATEASAAAREIGFPVAMKAFGDALPHKTELGLVTLGIEDEAAVQETWGVLQARVENLDGVEGFLVQEMIPGGVEMFAGVNRDPDFGLVLAAGLGGIAIELFRDVALRPLPLAEGDAEEMIAGLKAKALLGPVRGGPAADVESFAALLYRLSDFAHHYSQLIDEIDLNPVMVLPQGEGYCLVDALIVPAKTTTDARNAS